MKCFSHLALLLLFCFFEISASAQTTDSSTVYIHAARASSNARAVQNIFSLLGIKHRLLNYMTGKRRIPHRAAAVPRSLRSKLDVHTDQHDGRTIWIIQSKNETPKTTILYLHGGAYILNISSFHWKFLQRLAEQTHAEIIVPDYPLAPVWQAETVYAFIADLYRYIVANRHPGKLVVMGDSAGGGLSMGLCELLQKEQVRQPDEVILLSPWLDVTMSNPEVAAIDKTDKMLNVEGLRMAGHAYAGAWSDTDYRVSPLFGNTRALPPVSIFTGTHDVLLPDCRKLKAALQQQQRPFHYFEYPGMFHGWMVVTGLRESKCAMKQIVERVKR